MAATTRHIVMCQMDTKAAHTLLHAVSAVIRLNLRLVVEIMTSAQSAIMVICSNWQTARHTPLQMVQK